MDCVRVLMCPLSFHPSCPVWYISGPALVSFDLFVFVESSSFTDIFQDLRLNYTLPCSNCALPTFLFSSFFIILPSATPSRVNTHVNTTAAQNDRNYRFKLVFVISTPRPGVTGDEGASVYVGERKTQSHIASFPVSESDDRHTDPVLFFIKMKPLNQA